MERDVLLVVLNESLKKYKQDINEAGQPYNCLAKCLFY